MLTAYERGIKPESEGESESASGGSSASARLGDGTILATPPSTLDPSIGEVVEPDKPVKRRVNTPQWLKAPNGQPSNLNEQQWVMVRTPRFKAWFGDWEVAAAKPERMASTFGQAKQFAKEFRGLPLKNLATGMVAQVSRNNLDKMLSGKAVGKSETEALHSLAVANLDHLFQRAQLGWSKPDRDGDPNIKFIHRFFAPIAINGQAWMVKMTVKETGLTNDPNPLYTVEAVSFDAIKNPAAQWVAEMANADGVDPKTIRSAGLVKSMGQAVQNFKPGLVSKAIDENGEPLVVYHGADEKRTTAAEATGVSKRAALPHPSQLPDQLQPNIRLPNLDPSQQHRMKI